MPLFFRLIHITDLHFGSSLHDPDDASFTSGFEVHALEAVEKLALSIQEYRRAPQGAPTRIVATGDLTTWGKKSGFSLAFNFLRGHLYAGGQAGTVWLGLGDHNMPVIPGNHDAWDGRWPAKALLPFARRFSRASIEHFFHPPAANAVFPQPDVFFPYRICLFPGGRQSPPIYLYGLDSTRLDYAERPTLYDIRADGYIHGQQLLDLEALCQIEPPHENGSLRIAAIHHPLAWPTGRQHDWGVLRNEREVVTTLQDLGFCLALCGHLHKGFEEPARGNPNRAVLRVLSAGTATLNTRLPPPWYRHPFDGRGRVPNQFQVYDFWVYQRNASRVRLVLKAVEYDLNDRRQTGFTEQERPGLIRLDVRDYQPAPDV